MAESLKPGVLEDIKSRIRWYVNVRWIFLLALGLSGVIPSYLEFGGRGQFFTNLLIMALGLAYNGIFWFFARRDNGSTSYYRNHGVAQLLSDVLLASYLIFTHGGIESRSIIIYAIPIIASGALFSRIAIYMTAGVAVIIYNFILLGDYFGFMPSSGSVFLSWHEDGGFLLTSMLFYSAALLVIAMVSEFVTRLIEEQRKKAIKQSQSLEKAQAMAHLGNWEWDIAADKVSWSKELYRIFGLSPGQRSATYKSYLEYVHPDDRQRVDQIIKKAYESGQSFSLDHRTAYPSNAPKYIHSDGVVIRDSTGKAIKMSGTAQDVTEVKKQQLQLEQEGKRFTTEVAKTEALFESIGQGVIATDENAKVSRVNQEALSILGISEQEVAGKWFPKVIIALDQSGREIPPIERPITKAILSGQAETARMQFKTKTGKLIPVAVIAAPILLDNKPIGAVEVFRDITDEKKLEEAKDMFVSLTSHQLRTPLTAIRLFAEMLGEGQVGPLNPSQADYINKIEVSTKRMIQLVGEILNLSRIELGRLKVDPKPNDIVALIKSSVGEIMPLANEKGIAVTTELPEGLPKVDLDDVLFDQVVHNFLTNAIRYAKPQGGQVKIGLAKEETGYHLSVSDNGIGIPADVQPKIFERFFRAENAVAVVGEGTGLGLYLVKMIIEISGGKVWFESHEGVGTTFHVTIPLSGMRAKAGDKGLATSKD